MHSGNGILRRALAAALAGSLMGVLAGCGSVVDDVAAGDVSLGDTPAVSGNTFDRYNDLAVIPPHSENLSVSYLYELESPERGETAPGVNGPVWLFAERAAAIPESFFQIGLVSAQDEAAQPVETSAADGPIKETVRLGSIRYGSAVYCVDPSDAGIPADVAGFIRNIADHGYDLSNALFVRHYEGEKPGLDGRWLSMAFVLDITRRGYDCEAIGDPASPADEFREVVDRFKDMASRSFEVVR